MVESSVQSGLWVLPTLGRPKACQDFLHSAAAMGTTSRGIVVVDGDADPVYRDLQLPQGWTLELREENVGYLGCINRAFEEHPDEPWYGLLNDDFIVRTFGWDQKLAAAAGRWGFSNSNDGWQAGKRMAGALVFGGDMLRALGWWSPPGLKHCYSDDAWEAIGRALANWTPILDVMVEHKHAWTGKSEKDATHQKAYSHFAADRERYTAFSRHDLPLAIERLARAISVEQPEGARRLARAKSRSVMICTPISRDPVCRYTISMLGTQRELLRLGITHEICYSVGSSNLPRSRNGLVARFLASPFTDLLFIDDDMGWDPSAVVRLLASDKPAIAAVGRKKSEQPNSHLSVWACHFKPGSEKTLRQDEMGAIEIARVGTAFMKIERQVFEKLIAAHPEWKREGHDDMSPEQKACYYQFFRFDADNDGEESGEDYVFCDRWSAIGGEIWIDPTIGLKHVGSKEYEGAISEILQAAAA